MTRIKSHIYLALRKFGKYSNTSLVPSLFGFCWSHRSILLLEVRYLFKYSRVTAEKFSAQTIPPFSRSLSNHSERQIFFKGCASSFLLKRNHIKLVDLLSFQKIFIVYFVTLKMARLLSPLMIEVREPKSFEAMKFPTMITFLFIYMQNFSDLLSVHLNEPCNKLDFSLIQIQGL